MSRSIRYLFTVILFSITILLSAGQPSADSLLKKLNASSGILRVDILNQLAEIYEITQPDSSLYYASEAEKLAKKMEYNAGLALAARNKGNYYFNENKFKSAIEEYTISVSKFKETGDMAALVNSYYLLGKSLRISGDYDNALFNFLESLRISEEIGDKKGIAYANLNIGIIYSIRPEMSNTTGLPYFFKALKVGREINDTKCISYALNNIALVYIDEEEYDQALDYHLQSLKLKQASGNIADIASSMGNIADIYTLKGDYETSLRYNLQSVELYRKTKDTYGLIYNLLEIGRNLTHIDRYSDALPYLEEALQLSEEVDSYDLKSATYNYLYTYYLEQGNYRKALEFHEKYKTAEDSLYSEKSSHQIAELKTRYETEKKEADIQKLTNERKIQELQLYNTERQRLYFLLASILTFIIAGFAFYGFRQKQKANRFLEERNKFEIENKKKAIAIFGQQVSKEIALELLSDSFKSGSKKLFACIMFLDIRDFTPFVAKMEPDEIIQYQNDVFGFMIDVISKHNGIVNQFMGDGFMATFGAPVSLGNDCQNAVDASVEIANILNEKIKTKELPKTHIGIGLHAGYIVTGNVGTSERKQYSITGNTVILASRIEQLNKKYKTEILISKEVLEHIDVANLKTLNIGTVKLKGRTEPLEIVQLLV